MKIYFYKIWIISFLCLVSMTALLSQDCEKEARRWFDFANETYHQGSPEQQAVYDSIIIFCPNFDNAYFEKSVAFLKRGDYHTSFYWLDKAVDLNPKRHLGYRGWLKWERFRDYEGAIADFERLDTLTPNFTDYPWGDNIYYHLGICYRGLGDYKKAISNFDKAINEIIATKGKEWIAPLNYLKRGYCKRDEGDIAGAIEDFNNEIALNSTCCEAYFHRGILLILKGKRAEGIADIDKSLVFYKKGYVQKDSYNELPDNLYLSDIEDFIANGYK